MSQIVSSLTEAQKKKYSEKLDEVRTILWKMKTYRESATKKETSKFAYEEVLKQCATDPTIFAYLNLLNKKGQPYKLYDYQDLVINDNSRHVIVAKGRKIGFTDIASIKALHLALFNPNFSIVIASKTQNMAKRIIQRIREFLMTAPLIKYETIKGDTDNKFEVWIKNYGGKTHSKIISVVAGDQARGEDAHVLIIDEAAFIENGEYNYHEVLSPIVTYHNGQIILISTPPKVPIGFFTKAFKNEAWSRYHFKTNICPDITEKFLAEKRASMLEAQYLREYEAMFLSDENRAYTLKEVEDAVDENIILGSSCTEPVFIGIDWGETNSQSAYCIIKAEHKVTEQGTETRTQIIDMKTFPKRTDYMEVIREIQSICNKKYNVRMILADAGIGRGQISNMMDMRSNGELNCDMIEEFTFGGTHKADLVTENKMLFEKRRVKIPNDQQLINELNSYQQEYNPLTKRTKYHPPEGGDIKDHLLDAFHLANMAAIRLASPPVSLVIV